MPYSSSRAAADRRSALAPSLRRALRAGAFLLMAALFAAPVAQAQDLVYQPRNPAFGGSPLNYQWLLSSAQTQNAFQGGSSSRFDRDPLEDFQSDLQRRILRELSLEVVGDRFDGVNFSEGGRFDLGDFTIEVTDGLNGLNIRIFNVLTGEETTVTVPAL